MARQDVKFSLTAEGAGLESKAAFGALFGGGEREFIFNRPFLVMLLRKDARMPYFAAWIATDTLLVPEQGRATAAPSDSQTQVD
jgi:hypothetical protein